MWYHFSLGPVGPLLGDFYPMKIPRPMFGSVGRDYRHALHGRYEFVIYQGRRNPRPRRRVHVQRHGAARDGSPSR